LAATAVSQIATAYSHMPEEYSPYVGSYCTGAKAAELYTMINKLREDPSASTVVTTAADEDYYKWSTLADFIKNANDSVSNWMWMNELYLTDFWNVGSLGSDDSGPLHASQPLYVGIPRTSMTWDIQRAQLRYTFWEDYNPTKGTDITSTILWATDVTAKLTGVSADSSAFTWSEGLAKAAHWKNDRWLWCKHYNTCFNNNYQAPIMADGTSPAMRAEMFGTIGGTKK